MEALSYEMQIRCTSGTAEFYVDHRLLTFPGRETTVALKEEAEGTFEALFGHPVEEMYVSLSLSEREETEAEEVETRED